MKKFFKTLAIILCLTMTTPSVVSDIGVETVEAATNIKLNCTKKTMYVGDTFKLKISGTKKKVKWSSSDKRIATVSSKGVVKGIKEGDAKIITVVSGKKYTCIVKVKNVASQSIELDKTKIECVVGENAKIKATVLPSNTTDKTLQWSTGDESIVKVDSKGKVTGISSGETMLFVTNGNCTASCPITVKDIFSYENKVVENGILVNATSNKKSEIYAVEFTIKYYDDAGKLIYKQQYASTFYHVQKNRVCTFFIENPSDFVYSSYKIEANEFSTINYKLDLYDKIMVSDISIKEEDGNYILNYTVENPTEEIISYSEILFLCYKDGIEKKVIKVDCDMNVNTKKDYKINIDEMYDYVIPIISKAWVTY